MTDNRTNEPRRLKSCVEAWPECETGEYNPSCCRFPKSCSATVYSEEHVTEDDLEPPAALVAAQGAARPVNSFDTTAEREKNGGDSLHVAPQEPSGVTNANGHSWMSWNESGKNGTYCRSCGGWAGKVGNRQCSPAPVLPSSGVDVETLANLIHSTSVAHFGGLDPRVAPIIARAVAGWLKGQER